MFPHTITIYRHALIDGEDIYAKQEITGVYWCGAKGIQQSGKGITEDDQITIVTSPELTKTFGTEWSVMPGDRIIKGKGSEITSLKQIKGGITAMRVEESICGSDVDNVTITGR